MLGAFRGGRNLPRTALRLASSLSQTPCASSPCRPLIASRANVALSARSYHASIRRFQEAAPAAQEIPEQAEQYTRFQELADHGLVSSNVISTITQNMNIETMTDVQRLTINETLDGSDVIAQARTGTGKTLAFLIPIVQRILKDKALEQRSHRGMPMAIRSLIISPTRELAEQIAAEARKIVSNTDIRVQSAVGGTGKAHSLTRMKREGCHILVGTPGRVKDLLSDPYSGVKMDRTEVFVLDEADRLLDIGFMPDIEEIESYLPRMNSSDRQTLMFSATVPKAVVGLVRQMLRRDFKFIRTTDPNEQPTHERIPQKVVFLRGFENRLPAILELAHRAIKAHEQDPEHNLPFKAIVYFGATADVSLSYQIFNNMRGSLDDSTTSRFASPLQPAQVIEMHSRLSQAERTRNSAQFKQAKSAILFSSDVTARGMDFPNVSHVIQFGLPRNDDDYIHRLGRTGRAGKPGEGWLFVQEEQMREFKRGLGADLPIEQDRSIKTATVDMTAAGDIDPDAAKVMSVIRDAVKATPFMTKAQAYLAMLGILQQTYRNKQELVDRLNDLARFGWGLEELPVVSAALASRLSLTRTEGLNIQDRGRMSFESDGGGFERGRSGRGGFGGGRGGSRSGSFDDFTEDLVARNRGRVNYDDRGAAGDRGFGGRQSQQGDFSRNRY